jgi:hypothetical protein
MRGRGRAPRLTIDEDTVPRAAPPPLLRERENPLRERRQSRGERRITQSINQEMKS